jgi:hypothetical protein
LRGTAVRADIDALIAFNTSRRIPDDLTALNPQGALRVLSNAISAVIAEIDHVRIVAIKAIEIAALEEDNGAITGTVHKTL